MLKSGTFDKPPSRLTGALAGTRTITTYENVWNFKPRYVVESASIDDIRAAVIAAASSGLRVRSVGAGSSWASYLVTPDVCISLRKLNKIHNIDPANKTVTVDSGVLLGDLSRALAALNLSLPSLSFFPDVTIGGAVATATHGTSPHWGLLSDFVRSMHVVLASGEVKEFGPESPPEELRAARVAIGMLGVIVRLELQVVEIPWVRYSALAMDLSTFRAQLPSILSRYEHVWAHWTLTEDRVRVQCLESRASKADGFHRYNAIWQPSSRVLVQLLNKLGISTSSLLQFRDRHLSFARSARNRGASSALKADGDRGKVFMSMQYGIPASRIEMAIDRIRSSDFAAQNPGRIVEFKFIKGENSSYLGPNCDGDAVCFNLWWLVDESLKMNVFDSFEGIMKSINARPHWGKFHHPPVVEYMRATYPQWAEFEAVRAKFDPNNTFSIFQE